MKTKLTERMDDHDAEAIIRDARAILLMLGAGDVLSPDVDIAEVTVDDVLAWSCEIRAGIMRRIGRVFCEKAGVISEEPVVVGIPDAMIGHPDNPVIEMYDAEDALSEALATIRCADNMLLMSWE